MDRRCYEELLDERKNMELTYEERIAQLQDQHSEVRDLPFRYGIVHPCMQPTQTNGICLWREASTDACTSESASMRHERAYSIVSANSNSSAPGRVSCSMIVSV